MVKLHKQRLTVLLFITSCAFLIMYSYYINGYVVSYMVNLELIKMSTNYFTASLLLDKVSISFGFVVTLISGCVFMFGRWYMKDDVYYMRFVWILLAFVVSMNILIFSGSLFVLLIGWDGLGVTSFALIIYYQSKDSLSAGFLTLLINRIGDILIMSVMFYFVVSGSSLLLNYSINEYSMMLMLLSLAALTKSAQYPFSAWLPAAMAAPTPVSALVHSSTLVTAGIYILIRAFMSMELSHNNSSLLLFCGSMTSMIGGLCAMYENDLKKIVAFSTLSQLGVMVFSLGLGSQLLALLHLYTHAMFKALLFLVAGCVLMLAYGVQDVRMLGGVTKSNPILMVFLNISTLCLMGFPFLSAFYSKHLIISLMWKSSINMFAVLVMLVATILTGIYMIRLMKMMNWSVIIQPINFKNDNWSMLFYLPLAVLFIGSLLLGWGFNLEDPDYVMNMFMPISLELMMYSLLIISILVGLILYKDKGNYLLTKMFYMDPMWKYMNYTTNKLSNSFMKFESGWVEPYFYLNNFKDFLIHLNNKEWWPITSMSFTHYLMLGGVMSYTMWMYLS